MHRASAQGVAADVTFVCNRFPNYKLGLNNDCTNDEEDPPSPSRRELVSKEVTELLEQHNRLSVRDLANKFERGQAAAQAAAARLSHDARFREAALLDRQALLTKLRDVLEGLGGRVAGRNKDDAEEALTVVEVLAVQLAKEEGDLAQEKTEVQKLAALFKQASDDAKRMVEEARAVAHTEIETARAAAQRIEVALEEHERLCGTAEKKELEDLRREIQEARRIKMLHESSKAMDMEHEIEGLRQHLLEKTAEVRRLKKELEVMRGSVGTAEKSYQLEGNECLGSCLQVLDETTPDLSECNIQWYRVSPDGNKAELISGATKTQYAPEPFDVGRYLTADISLPNSERVTVSTHGIIDPAPGLGNYVEALVRKGGAEFQVVIIQQNGEPVSKQSLYGFNVGRMRIKVHKGRATKAKEPYSAAMQLCGARGGGSAAAQGLFWQAKKGLSFLLAFESTRERNASIMLARRFAFDCNIMLAGPDDRAPLGM
eukprot:c27305_g1_i1 orf=464-1924(-)